MEQKSFSSTEGKTGIVIITAAVHSYLLEYLHQHGYQVDYTPSATYDELIANIHTATGLIVTTRIKVDKPMLESAGSLKWIARLLPVFP